MAVSTQTRKTQVWACCDVWGRWWEQTCEGPVYLGVLTEGAAALCTYAEDWEEGEAALNVECAATRLLFWLVGEAALGVPWGSRWCDSVWLGERDCEPGPPYGTGEDGFRGECSSLGLREGGVKGISGDRGDGEWSGRPGLCGPGDMGPAE